MAATIDFNGFGVVDTADSTTGWAALKIAGTGGGPAVGTADGHIEGTGAVDVIVSKQHVALYFDIGASNELDFSGGGTEEGQMVYIWAQFLAPALINTVAAGGFGVFLESSTPGTAQYHEWYFYGSDLPSSGWVRFVLDPTKPASASAGTAINTAAIRYFGVFAGVAGTAKFANLNCDQIAVGKGLRIYGTSTTDDLKADLVADEETNRNGVILLLNGSNTALGLNGSLELGDQGGIASPEDNASVITDVGAKFFVEEPLYWDTSASPQSFQPSVPLGFFSITCRGNTTATTTITIGKEVDATDEDDDTGRSGWLVVGNDTYNVAIDFNDGNVDQSDWNGSTFENCTGAITWQADKSPQDNGLSLVFDGCGQFNPIGNVRLRDLQFVNYNSGTSPVSNGALLWNDTIDIKNSAFLNCDIGIEHE